MVCGAHPTVLTHLLTYAPTFLREAVVQFMENTSNSYLSPTVGGDNEVEDRWKVKM